MGITLGEYLKTLRLERNLTTTKVAEKVKVSNEYISQLERSQKDNMSVRVLARLSMVYGVPMDIFLTEAGLRQEYKPEVPLPNAEFIRAAYDELNVEQKKLFRGFLKYLQKKGKKPKRPSSTPDLFREG
jgi:transcriptional regulator with XRE-family HTH domain